MTYVNMSTPWVEKWTDVKKPSSDFSAGLGGVDVLAIQAMASFGNLLYLAALPHQVSGCGEHKDEQCVECAGQDGDAYGHGAHMGECGGHYRGGQEGNEHWVPFFKT